MENNAIFVSKDSQIDFATRNVFFLTFLLDLYSPCLESFQPKIDNEFKMCSLNDANDVQNRVLAKATRPVVYANSADQ